jgi:hypothetical protein
LSPTNHVVAASAPIEVSASVRRVVRLPETELALDLDVVEVPLEPEPFDLPPLLLARPVRH